MNQEFSDRKLETDISELSQNKILKKNIATQKFLQIATPSISTRLKSSSVKPMIPLVTLN